MSILYPSTGFGRTDSGQHPFRLSLSKPVLSPVEMPCTRLLMLGAHSMLASVYQIEKLVTQLDDELADVETISGVHGVSIYAVVHDRRGVNRVTIVTARAGGS